MFASVGSIALKCEDNVMRNRAKTKQQATRLKQSEHRASTIRELFISSYHKRDTTFAVTQNNLASYSSLRTVIEILTTRYKTRQLISQMNLFCVVCFRSAVPSEYSSTWDRSASKTHLKKNEEMRAIN